MPSTQNSYNLYGSLRTASSNTRLNSQITNDDDNATPGLVTHIDYLTFYKDKSTYQEFQSIVDFIDNNVPVEYTAHKSATLGIKYYHHRFSSLDGCISGGYTVYDDEDADSLSKSEQLCDWFFQLSGKYWEMFDTRASWRLLRGLRFAYKVTVTRLDIAVDDRNSSLIKVGDFVEVEAKRNYSGVGTSKYIRSRGKGEDCETVYFGSRQSPKYWRIYKHDDFPRLELETKRKIAVQIFEYLTDLVSIEGDDIAVENCFSEALGRFAVGGLDFVDRGGKSQSEGREKNLDRCVRLSFWQLIIDALGEPVRVVSPAPVHHNLSKTLRWIERQVIGSLLVLKKAYEGSTLAGWKQLLESKMLLFEKSNRWSSRHQLMLDTFLNERDFIPEVCQ